MVDSTNRMLAGLRFGPRPVDDLTARVSSVPQTPLAIAAETLRECVDELHVQQHRPDYWRSQAWAIIRDGREDRTAVERLVIRRYREAQQAFRAQEGL
jgi:hypothetical protein